MLSIQNNFTQAPSNTALATTHSAEGGGTVWSSKAAAEMAAAQKIAKIQKLAEQRALQAEKEAS